MSHGVSASQETLLSWCKMFEELAKEHLGDTPLSEFQLDLQQQLSQFANTFFDEIKNLTLDSIRDYLEGEVEKGNIKIMMGQGMEKKYRLADIKKTNLYKSQKEVFFLSSQLSYKPAYFFQSKLQNWLQELGVSNNEIIELCIATTEAIENTIKYSDRKLVVVCQSLEKQKYKLFMANFAQLTSNGFPQGKHSERASLTRGILIMSKIFDEFNIDQNDKKNIVFITGSKTIN